MADTSSHLQAFEMIGNMMKGMSFRWLRAIPDDASLIVGLREMESADEMHDDLRHARAVISLGLSYVIVDDENKIMGYLLMQPILKGTIPDRNTAPPALDKNKKSGIDETWWIRDFFVMENLRRRGYGTIMMEVLLHPWTGSNVKFHGASPNEYANLFFARLWFYVRRDAHSKQKARTAGYPSSARLFTGTTRANKDLFGGMTVLRADKLKERLANIVRECETAALAVVALGTAPGPSPAPVSEEKCTAEAPISHDDGKPINPGCACAGCARRMVVLPALFEVRFSFPGEQRVSYDVGSRSLCRAIQMQCAVAAHDREVDTFERRMAAVTFDHFCEESLPRRFILRSMVDGQITMADRVRLAFETDARMPKPFKRTMGVALFDVVCYLFNAAFTISKLKETDHPMMSEEEEKWESTIDVLRAALLNQAASLCLFAQGFDFRLFYDRPWAKIPDLTPNGENDEAKRIISKCLTDNKLTENAWRCLMKDADDVLALETRAENAEAELTELRRERTARELIEDEAQFAKGKDTKKNKREREVAARREREERREADDRLRSIAYAEGHVAGLEQGRSEMQTEVERLRAEVAELQHLLRSAVPASPPVSPPAAPPASPPAPSPPIPVASVEQEECPVCLGDTADVMLLYCCHSVCRACFLDEDKVAFWREGKCPACRESVEGARAGNGDEEETAWKFEEGIGFVFEGSNV